MEKEQKLPSGTKTTCKTGPCRRKNICMGGEEDSRELTACKGQGGHTLGLFKKQTSQAILGLLWTFMFEAKLQV